MYWPMMAKGTARPTAAVVSRPEEIAKTAVIQDKRALEYALNRKVTKTYIYSTYLDKVLPLGNS